MSNHDIIGTRQRRVDAWGKVTGRAKFAEDYGAPHQLVGRVLHAAHAHARIVRIDTARAAALPGVAAVLTASDIPGSKTFGVVTPNQRILADDRVRYLGDGVALVAAVSRAVADEAAALIEVTYEPLPVLGDPEAAMAPDAPKIHGEDNVFVRHEVRRGDVAQGFGEADFIIERRFRTQMIEHAYLEPEAVLAEPDEQGGVRITGSIQNLFSSRRSVAAALGLDLAAVQLVQSTLGGSFGGKDEVMTSMCCRAALLALATGRPVKMVNTREESMRESYKRHPYILDYKWGARRDGSITAMKIRCVADGGAYASMSPFVTWRSVVQATGPYHCPNVETDVVAVYTNNNYTGAMRGFGAPQVNFAIESMMDELAERVGKDPAEIRLQNGFERGSVTATGQRLDHEVSLKEVIQKAIEASGFADKHRAYAAAPPAAKKKGIGLACSYRGVSLGAEGTDAVGAIASVQTDGSVIVSSGITDMGQGAQTQMSQIVAEVLGIGMERIRFLNTNTSRVPDSGPTVASRGTIMGGGAAKKAAEIVRETLLEAGAQATSRPASDLALRRGHLVVASTGEQLFGFSALAAECFRQGRPMYGLGWHKAPRTSWHEHGGQGDAYFTFVYGANVAEVEVDTETGKVDVIDFVSVHEVGQAISRSGVEAQIYGGAAMGLGYGLFEDFEIEDGVPRQANFDEYLIPTALDVPRVRAILVENPDPAGPFGAKSIGEPANEIAAPAILNAIANATGRRIRELPATLERVTLGHALHRPGPRGSASKDAPSHDGGSPPKPPGPAGTTTSKQPARSASHPFEYIRCANLEEATAALGARASNNAKNARIIAGGTDVVVDLRQPGARWPAAMIDISGIAALRGISEENGQVRVGPLATHTEIHTSALIQGRAGLLAEASRAVGSEQVRNRGTVGGNVMNAATCADTVPALVALDARVTLASAAGTRDVAIADFFEKPYHTRARPDEILASITFAALPPSATSAFVKLGRRNALSIARISVAAVLARDAGGVITEARIVPGSALPVWKRLDRVEAMLVGEKPSADLFEAAGEAVSAAMIEASGRRWSSEYKEPVLAVIVRRALERCVAGAAGEGA